MNRIPTLAGSFVLYLIFQVVLFDRFTVFGYATPHVFLLFLLMLPLYIPYAWILVISFFSGLLVDIFSSNLLYGLHAFSCVTMMSIREFWVNIISSKSGYRGTEDFDLRSQPFMWYVFYLFPLIFVHHLFYYILEAFGFENFGQTFSKIILSSLFTFILCMAITLLWYNKSGRRR